MKSIIIVFQTLASEACCFFQAKHDTLQRFRLSVSFGQRKKLTTRKCFFKRRKSGCINTYFVTCISGNVNEFPR